MNFLNTAPWLHSYEMRINSTTSQLRLLSLAPGKQAEEPRSAQALSSIRRQGLTLLSSSPSTPWSFGVCWVLGGLGSGVCGFFVKSAFPPPHYLCAPLFVHFVHPWGWGPLLHLCRTMHKADLIYACTCMQQYIMTLRYFSATGMLLTELFSFPLFINKD